MSIYNGNSFSSVYVGAAANDGTGDPLRNAFIKVNNNFIDLYTFLGNGTHLGNISEANLGNVTIGNVIGNLIVTGAIISTGTAPASFKGNTTFSNIFGNTAVFTGNVTAGNLLLTGNIVSGSIGPAVVFPSTGATAGTYGDATNSAQVTVDKTGRITSITSVAITGGGGPGGGATNLDSLTDVVITTPTNGQVLKFNGSNWINDTDLTGGGGGAPATIGPFVYNTDTITSSVTIPSGNNAFSVGPITQLSGVVVTVSPGQRWVLI